MPDAAALLACVDVLIAGRYEESQRQARGLLGSANQTTHLLTDRYRLEELRAVPEAEVILLPNGELLVSGIAPLKL